jgi:Spy/CpxP family protein refolding chaperone
MKKCLPKMVLIVAIASLLSTGSAVAQHHKGDSDWQRSPQSTEEKLARISAALDLSDQQSLDMLAILQQRAESRAAIHEQKMELLGPEVCAQRAETEAAILAILTAEQTELFLQIKEDRQSNPDRKGHAGRRLGELDCPD